MVQRCREHDVEIYVDVVINHMAGGSLGDPLTKGRASTPWQYRCITLSEVARHSEAETQTCHHHDPAPKCRNPGPAHLLHAFLLKLFILYVLKVPGQDHVSR